MYLIVGLGNPGTKYQNTRHNIGFDVVTELSRKWMSSDPSKKSFGSLVESGFVSQEKCVLALPQKYMNRSGQPVASLQGYYKIPNDKIIVVHDDLDLDSGTVRCKRNGGHGGHNGLRDIIQHLGKDFLRIRVGIGRPPQGWETSNYVLGRWTTSEKEHLEKTISTALDAIESILTEGVQNAMNKFNIRNTN